MTRLRLCPFCFEEESPSREHLFSQPICDALGLDRETVAVSYDANSGETGVPVPLSQRTVKLPCSSCNSGWMSQLEVDTGSLLAGWARNRRTALGAEGVDLLTRWLVKTLFVLGFAEGDSRHFMVSPTETMVPDVATAKQLIAGERLEGVAAGAARSARTSLLWTLGNPSVVAPAGLSSRVVNAAAFNMGPIQLWVAVPLQQPDNLVLPARIASLEETLAFSQLLPGQSSLDLSRIRATYSTETANQILMAIETAEQQASRSA
jgi:hypothetical protein